MAMSRGIMMLDSTWGKKHVWCPYVRNWGLSEANVLCWRKCLWHCWDFLPHIDATPGELCPPLLRLWLWGMM